ncbi:UDP-glucose 4-epimerase GalE [Mycolicibacterium hippocampi]|uniref:UDP-glucose 4-epimerase n=1 Tax=Mycolicibacterium hippocampi TaxID=659824 RepID=A0A7I9ZWW2_9MYCO|nr:UDP-glucose 4-epimerase GalE [Mycolicibacterium hippocampi]
MVRALLEAVLPVVVIDDLSTGFEQFVPESATFVRGTLLDRDLIQDTLQRFAVRGVIHIAGYKYAGESVKRPLHTYEQNVTTTVNLLQAMEAAGVDRIVFSSSAATFGTPDVEIVDETTPTTPESPYGETKLIGEWLLRDAGLATGLRHTSLRYFNVVGSGSQQLFDASPHNLFPKVFDMLYRGATPSINGDDYPTPTAPACATTSTSATWPRLMAAARRLDDGLTVEPVYNLGSGAGTSVREIMTAVRTVTGVDFEPQILPRRPGDPARIVAAGDLAARDLGWQMRHSLEQMVASAWKARQSAGDAYPRS